MARLDPLISAMLQHSADGLVVAAGRQPSLSMNGSERTCAKQVLEAAAVSELLAEIAPTAARSAILAGSPTTFVYSGAGNPVHVDVKPGPAAYLRPGNGQAPAAAAAPKPVTPTISSDAPLMDRLFHDLVAQGGSDVHVSSEARPMIRVDGDLKEMAGYEALDAEAAERALLQIAPERNREEFKETGDTDFAYEIEGLCRFRCNMFLDRKGPGGVFRIIPTDILTAEQLGLSKEICDLAFLTKGLVLVTGPTGSGKSTTLAAMIDLVNSSRSDHVITIEDPIEFVHPNKKCLVNQREVHIHTSGFKKALRAALREDPDVVLVGELRDLETIAIAIETAETGHLVFGTLHTTSAVSTVDRIIDQFPVDQQEQIRIMLSESLKAVIAQVLCKKIGGGRAAALEVLMVNAAVSNLIREAKTFQIPSIMQTGKKLGMVMLNDALLELVQKKTIEPREAYVKAIDKLNLVSQFKSKNVPLDFLEQGGRPPQG